MEKLDMLKEIKMRINEKIVDLETYVFIENVTINENAVMDNYNSAVFDQNNKY